MSKKLGAISVRFNEEQHQGLAWLTEITKLDNAALIRMAVDGLVDYAKAHGGRLMLPLDFSTAWTELRAALDDDMPAPEGVNFGALKVAESAASPAVALARKKATYRRSKS